MIDRLLTQVETGLNDPEFVKEILVSLSDVLKSEEKFLELKDANAVFIGDIHGDFSTLKRILKEVHGHGTLIVLGDYVDRGPQQIEVLLTLALLKLSEPKDVILLRGNHEPPEGLMPYPHDFPEVLRGLYGYEWGEKLYRLSFLVFQHMPYTVKIGSFLALHGGLPVYAEFKKVPDPDLLEEVLWNDPIEAEEEAFPSPRGAGYLFGPSITMKWAKKLGFKRLVRGHEPCNGYRFNHDGMVVTLFSRLGPPYYNSKAAVALKKGGELEFIEFE